jgi:hypothetical protein
MRSLQALRIPVLVALAVGAAPKVPGQPTTYEDLLSLFQDWRSFQKPKLAGGVPDYTPAAMAAQRSALAGYRKRLAAIDSAGWPVPQKVDYQVVRAEMNGLDFDHRVLQPWARNPAFYVTVVADESDQPAREGPFAYGTVDQLIAARQRALGGDFMLRRFMDELDAAGPVPISLVRWELTGEGDRVPGVGFAQPRNNR